MKASSLSVKECVWTSKECHLVDGDLQEDLQRDRVCLPNIFRPKKWKSLIKRGKSPSFQVYYTARELFLETLDVEAIQELIRRSAGTRAGAQRFPHSPSKEWIISVSDGEYGEALTLFSIVLQSGLSLGDSCTFASELTLKLGRQHGLLKRNSIHTHLLSLTRLQQEDKQETLSAFCYPAATRLYSTLVPNWR